MTWEGGTGPPEESEQSRSARARAAAILDTATRPGAALAALVRPAGVAVFVSCGRCDLVDSTEHFRELLGLGPDDPVTRLAWLDAVHPDDRERIEVRLRDADPAEDLVVHFRLVSPSYAGRWVRIRQSRLEVAEYENLFVGWVADITQVLRAETALRESEARLRDQSSIFEMIATGTPLPETLAEICRFAEGQLNGAIVTIQVADDPEAGQPQDPAAWSMPVRAPSDGRVLGTLFVDAVNGPNEDHDRITDTVVHLAAIAIENREFEERLSVQARHDPLTGLPNRALFAELLDHALARARRSDTALAVLFLDLDRFKVVNDNFGHEAGDDVLATLSQRLQRQLRPGDVLARFGGDEFTLLCEDLDADAARRQAVGVADRIVHALGAPFAVGGVPQYVGASIGIAIAASGEELPETLLRNADAAMYRAKDRGRGGVEVFDDGMRDQADERRAIEHALSGAAQRGELRVFYQPVISLVDGSCTGVEALLRWQHPERGLLGPADFLSAAEDSGLIVSIGAWLLEEACTQVLNWQRDQLGPRQLRVGVNFSARQLVQHDFHRVVSTILGRTGLPAAALCVEITETALMEDMETGVSAVKALKAAGVRTSIDDFGTGYSTLGYLRKFPIDEVKIHQSFVERLGTDPDDSAIVGAVVSLSHALGMTVTGEGVETNHQLEELRALGVDSAQGFLLAPPQPARDLAAYLARAHAWV